jgi:F-box-like
VSAMSPKSCVTITESEDTGLRHQNVTIETLPDDVLLAIFTCYLDQFYNGIDLWRTLVHVCQRWRYLVFASPGHLNLRLECTIETRAREMLDVWPPFPIIITNESSSMFGVDNILAALEQRDRVCQITLDDIPGLKMNKFVPAMLEPFPALEGIIFASDDAMGVVPDSFLGGSAPKLQWFTLHAMPFPALPTLLSSTRNLVNLQLSGIPRLGYISPEAMVTCLSAMPRLGSLRFQFDSPKSFPNRENRRHPPLARSTLPALRNMIFEGIDEYFEDLIARIDTPVIHQAEISFFPRHFYDFSQLSRFIGRVEVFKSPAHTSISLSHGMAEVLVSPRREIYGPARLSMGISCYELHVQLRYLVQVCSSSLLPLSNVESLAISSVDRLQQSNRGPSAEDFLWLDLLHPFSAVKHLHIDENSMKPVAYTLKEVVKERITEIFPAIRELSIGQQLPSGSILRAIEKFATARGLFTRFDRPYRWVAG